ncbi:hypothetical protein [Hymenobacter rubidus]|uniref:hypothetical protein n=1 Tax=Hymenobacter rubidus TaxID=1441626 RepID=UPI00191FA1DF|nr:hypothetical protein [Hymenobacter rubidus]
MKNNVISLCALLLLLVGTFSCKKEYGDNQLGPLQDSLADIPVTVTNATYFERFPVIEVKGATAIVPPATTPSPATPTTAQPGAFSITFSIPADKGKIKEITRVATGAAGLNYLQNNVASVATATVPSRAITPNELALNYNGNAANPGTTVTPGNGTNTITFNSSLLAYNDYRNRVGPLLDNGATGLALLGAAPVAVASLTAPVQLSYFFLLTLEDGRQIIPTQVRVRVAL